MSFEEVGIAILHAAYGEMLMAGVVVRGASVNVKLSWWFS